MSDKNSSDRIKEIIDIKNDAIRGILTLQDRFNELEQENRTLRAENEAYMWDVKSLRDEIYGMKLELRDKQNKLPEERLPNQQLVVGSPPTGGFIYKTNVEST